MRYIVNIILGLITTTFFLWLALRGINFDLVDETIRSTNWIYLLLPMIFWSGGILARAMRWRGLLQNKLEKDQAVGIISIVYMVNATIPLRAGELIRLYLTSRSNHGISGWTVLTTVLTETLLDMISIVLLLACVIPLLAISTTTIMLGAVIGGVTLIGFIILLMLAHRPEIAHRFLDKLHQLIPPLQRLPLKSLLEKLLQGIEPLKHRHCLRSTILWTVIIWICSILAVWSGAQAFPELAFSIDMLPILVFMLVTISLGAIIPFTMAGVGPFEAGVVFALTLADVSQSTALTFGIILHILLILHLVLWGMIGITLMRLSAVDVKDIGHYVQYKFKGNQTHTNNA